MVDTNDIVGIVGTSNMRQKRTTRVIREILLFSFIITIYRDFWILPSVVEGFMSSKYAEAQDTYSTDIDIAI